MRFLTIAILGLCLAAAPAVAQQNTQHVFGTTTCQERVPCSDSTENMSAADLAHIAEGCIKSSLSLNNPDGFFDEYAGVDSSGCLTNKPTANSSNGKNIVPVCCEMKLPDNTCTFQCRLVSGH